MKYKMWLNVLLISCGLITVVAGWSVRNTRHKISFAPKDENRAEFVALAKTSRYVDIGVIGVVNGKPDELPVPKKEIDAVVNRNPKFVVMKWITGDEMVAILPDARTVRKVSQEKWGGLMAVAVGSVCVLLGVLGMLRHPRRTSA